MTKNDNENPVYLTKEIVDEAGVSIITVYSYLSRYTTTDGLSLGAKIGGRWKIYAARFRRFLREGGIPKVR